MIGNVQGNQFCKQRQPALFCVVAFALGVFLDHQLSRSSLFVSLETWIGLGFLFLSVWGIFSRVSRTSARWALVLLAALLVSCGGLIHHLQWHVAPSDLLAKYARSQSTPARLLVRIESGPVFLPNSLPQFASAWKKEDQTRCDVRVLKLFEFHNAIPVSGKALLTIRGDATHLHCGDTVRITGAIRNLSPALNPASFDYAHYLRQRGILTSIFCPSAEAVVIQTAQSWNWFRYLSGAQQQLRRYVRAIYVHSLGKESVGIALALLLGERHYLEKETAFSFRRSGLMHLLSISGLHVGLIGYLSLVLGRILGFSQRYLLLLMLFSITLCLLLAELRPPVLRAWIIGVLFISGWAMHRPVSFLQSLSLAAWVILLLNSAWLFDRGTQLSFLAMLGVYGLWRILPGLFLQSDQRVMETHREGLSGTFDWIVRGTARYLFQSLVISLAITILMIPLLANSFFRVTLTGIPATVLSLPILALSLILLILLGIAGAVSSTLAHGIAIPVTISLNVLNSIAEFFSSDTLLQWSSCRPSNESVLVLYVLGTLAFVWSLQNSPRFKSYFLVAWLLLVVGSLEGNYVMNCLASWRGSGVLESRVLSVGHGNATLVKCPNGKMILLDAGSMENGKYAASVVLANLADMGTDRLDAILISHADTDHLNAVPFLLAQIPIREILLNPAALNPFHPGMQAIVSEAFERNVPLRFVQKEDLVLLDRTVSIRIRQCPASPLERSGNDNADSIVVELESRGIRLLFPGDLEGKGQEKLMQQVSPGYNVLLAPHHGGRGENTPEFSDWAKPDCVVISNNDNKMQSRLETVYGPSRSLYFTSQGAIRVQIFPQGTFRISQWHPLQYWQRRNR